MPNRLPKTTTHIAEMLITIGQRKIQRCAVCGLKMVDNVDYLKGNMLAAGTTTVGVPFWEPGAVVRIGKKQSYVIPCDNGELLPDDSCLDLVEN